MRTTSTTSWTVSPRYSDPSRPLTRLARNLCLCPAFLAETSFPGGQAVIVKSDSESPFQSAFRDFIKSDDFPCVGAKAAAVRSQITFFEGSEIDRPMDDLPLYESLRAFGDSLELERIDLQSFVAGFEGPRDLTEEQFEAALWNRLQSLHNLDAAAGIDWSDKVSSDPDSPHFSMSVGGRAYFVIGLHPNASRAARRFSQPALVFNSHEQFVQLREEGKFELMQKAIRKRDRALDGDINPMLSDHGQQSETRQYSGRKLSPDWTAPIKIRAVVQRKMENHD